MKRFAVLILVCALVALWAACAVHADPPFSDDPLGASAHGLGCAPGSVFWLATTLPLLALTGRLGFPPDARRLPAPPIFLFQPPD